MTVYLGDNGTVLIERKSGAPINATLEPADVSIERRRFSFGDHDVQGELISGDQIDLISVDGTDLTWIDGHNYPDWRGYVFIDPLGGIRLFDDFAGSLAGVIDEAVVLRTPSASKQIRITTRNNTYNYIGKVSGYEITTSRDTVDITQLGDEFKKSYEAGLISGQGQLNCNFEFRREKYCASNPEYTGLEYSVYLAQLCIRLTQGADFLGRFYIYDPGRDSDADSRFNKQAVWYEAECLVNNCIVNVNSGQIVETTISFVTTGMIKLLTGAPPQLLLNEDGTLLLQERSIGRLIGSVEDEITSVD